MRLTDMKPNYYYSADNLDVWNNLTDTPLIVIACEFDSLLEHSIELAECWKGLFDGDQNEAINLTSINFQVL